MIRHVIFDLDDTLCDFAAARRRGLESAFSLLAPADRDRAAECWNALEPRLYGYFSQRVLSLAGYRRLRFASVLSALRTPGSAFPDPDALAAGREADAVADDLEAMQEAMNARFMTEVNDRVGPTPGAVDCLRELASRGLACHVFTNGPYDGQIRKLEVTGLAPLVNEVFVSERLGTAKPDPEAFQQVLSRLRAQPAETVMVGDSLSNDVLPALELGMHALHFAPDDESGTEPTTVVRSLLEVPRALAALQ